ncbi:MAG: pyrroline-5-carboxylate reductase [Dorea sp.]|jgi:pyrroline-5-carboxylate reductase|nr:pyrroline-5-carboxylate reductase [Dorea sp.]
MITKKLGIIGCGNMGGAILYGAMESGVIAKENVFVYDINPSMRNKASDWGVTVSANDAEVCRNADMILLAVKPQQAEDALAMCEDALDNKAMMSIVAGVTTERLQAMTNGTPRILRIMPNTPAMVYEGAFALCSDNNFTKDELASAKSLYETIGIVEMVPEHLIDAVCGLSGGGPAYAAMFIEAMADGGVKQGLPRTTAYRLAAQTCLGTAKMILETDLHPGQIKDMVTSPAGTTIEGCEKLETGGMRGAVMECIKAAAERSKAL